MSGRDGSWLARGLAVIFAQLRSYWSILRTRGPNQLQFWLIALAIGVAAGGAALAFRRGIALLQKLSYGAEDVHRLHSLAGGLPWYVVLVVPIIGGLIAGILLHVFTPDGRVRSVADVVEGAALNEGRVEGRAGLGSALASLVTLGTGGSSGREGPVVHLVAVMSSWVLNRLKADGIKGRDLLGCAVAAAVSASFNAPIAGALFALEVVLRHFAIHAFAPITVAAVAGAVISRLQFGETVEFVLPGSSILEFYEELPAFLLLGAVCGVVAGLFMRAIFLSEDIGTRLQGRFRIPRFLRPAVAGALLGVMAIWFPHIIGVGYETTLRALSGELLLQQAILFALIKALATAITMGGRMGGGVFSPSMMLGALTGLAFGFIATGIFPDQSGSPSLYALAGLGGVAAAVLGAPISTTLIVFELTGNWTTALAVMVTVSISTAIGSKLVKRSFFLTQLERRGIHLAAGPQEYLLAMFRVRDVMRPCGAERAAAEATCWEMVEKGLYIDGGHAGGRFPGLRAHSGALLAGGLLPQPGKAPELLGALFHVDALRTYNRALAATAREEHS